MELEDIVNEEMLTTEDVNNMLEHTDKGRTKQTIRNCVTVLQNDPVLKKAIKRPVEPAPPLSHAIKGRHAPRTFPYLSLAPTAARIT